MTPHRRKPRESTIALINIVFLMLIFFLVAGTLAAPMDPDVTLVETSQIAGTPPPDALVIHQDGSLTHRGAPVSDPAAYVAILTLADRQYLRIVPDRDLPAAQLIRIGRALQSAGAETVVIVTEQGLDHAR